MKIAQVVELFTRLRAANPHPRSELVFDSPFELLVAVILSAQATDRSVNLATRPLFAVANTARKIRALGLARLTPYVKSIGLYNAKAKNIIAMATILDERYAGEVPRTREELEALPGVGRKTANVVLNTAFGVPVTAVDTHVFRVANRTGLASGRTVRAVEDRLAKVIPAQFAQNAHHWLILHGRYLCTARGPKCWRCPISDLCRYPKKSRNPAAPVPMRLPRPAARATRRATPRSSERG